MFCLLLLVINAANAVGICSVELGCKMNFGIYLPQKSESTKVPVIYWLSGKKTSCCVYPVHLGTIHIG